MLCFVLLLVVGVCGFVGCRYLDSKVHIIIIVLLPQLLRHTGQGREALLHTMVKSNSALFRDAGRQRATDVIEARQTTRTKNHETGLRAHQFDGVEEPVVFLRDPPPQGVSSGLAILERIDLR